MKKYGKVDANSLSEDRCLIGILVFPYLGYRNKKEAGTPQKSGG